MTKGRKIERAKNITLLVIVVLTLCGLKLYAAIDIDDIRAKLELIKGKDTIMLQRARNTQIYPKKVVLEPTIQQVKDEIIRQAVSFDLSAKKMLLLADCESDFKWDAENPNSTATGVYQYLIGTWGQTASSKKGISRFDYKANIREAMIDISNEESWRWQECLDEENLIF